MRAFGVGGIGAIRHFFYITNDERKSAAEVVLSANGRCNQENLLAQWLGGAAALRAPVDTLLSNWAYSVMASLAWTPRSVRACQTEGEVADDPNPS